MALKADRSYLDTGIDFFSSAVMERGGVLSISTVGSGSAMDQGEAVATYPANASGLTPLGILTCEVVNKDLTQTHLNWYKEEVQVGGKVTYVSKGWVVTDMIYPGLTIAAGDTAYVVGSGLLTNAPHGTPVATPVVGYFTSSKDEDGFAKVVVNLPNGQAL